MQIPEAFLGVTHERTMGSDILSFAIEDLAVSLQINADGGVVLTVLDLACYLIAPISLKYLSAPGCSFIPGRVAKSVKVRFL